MNVKRRKQLSEAQRLAKEILVAPITFREASLKELVKVCNGCGSGCAKFDFVPDKIYGTYIGAACDIHDWEYEIGLTEDDKEVADRTFLFNTLTLIDKDCAKKWYKPRFLMRRRAQKYYAAVKLFGDKAFYKRG